MNVKTRKGSVEGLEWEIIDSYIKGESQTETAKRLGLKLPTIQMLITKVFQGIKVIRETSLLIEAQNADLKNDKFRSLEIERSLSLLRSETSEEFIKLVSEPNDPVLTDAELMFSYLVVEDGDEIGALNESGLDVGLKKTTTAGIRGRKLRALYLKNKPNVNSYIKELQSERAKTMEFSRETLQSKILQLINRLEKVDDVKTAPTIAKLTEQLGKLHGLFVDKQIVGTQSLDDAFADMVARRKKEIEDEPSV